MKPRPPSTEPELQVCLYFHFAEFWKTAAKLKRLQARKAASFSRLRTDSNHRRD